MSLAAGPPAHFPRPGDKVAASWRKIQRLSKFSAVLSGPPGEDNAARAARRTRRHSISRGEEPIALPITFSKDDLAPKGLDRIVVHPDNRLKVVWEIFILLSVLFTAIVEPLKVTYDMDILPTLDIILDICFVLDVILQCFCGYHDSGGHRFPVLVFSLVVRRYSRTWLPIDILAAIPYDRFFAPGSDTSPLIRLPGLIKTVRLLKLKRIMRKWNSLTIGPVLKVLTVLVLWLLAAHWVSCGYFLLGWYSCGTYRETWVTKYWSEMRASCMAGERPNPSVVVSDTEYYVTPVTFFSVHMRTMYWAMATMSSMGYGRAPTAFTDIEYAYAVCTQVMGACLAAAIFSHVGQMLNKGDQVTIRYQAQLDKVREFSALYRLSSSLQTKLANYSELLFAVNRGYDTSAIAALFPAAVQEEIWMDMHLENVQRVPMFRAKGCDEFFISLIVRALRVNVLLDGDFAFRQGEVGDKMYFIKTGYIQIGMADRSIVYVSKGPGTYVGELTLFNPGQRRSASAWSLCDCVLFTLSIADFKAVLELFDKDGRLYEQMRHITQSEAQKQRQLNSAKKCSVAGGAATACAAEAAKEAARAAAHAEADETADADDTATPTISLASSLETDAAGAHSRAPSVQLGADAHANRSAAELAARQYEAQLSARRGRSPAVWLRTTFGAVSAAADRWRTGSSTKRVLPRAVADAA